MLNKLAIIQDKLDSQLICPIPMTPFHCVKQENNYIIVLGNKIVAKGSDIELLAENFENEKWNIIWYMIFTVNDSIENLKMEETNNE